MTEEGESATDATRSTLDPQGGDGDDNDTVSYETPSSAQQLDISSHDGLSVHHTGEQELDLSGLSISPSHSSTPRAPAARYQRTGRVAPSTPSTSAYGNMTSQLEDTQLKSMTTPGKSARKQNISAADDLMSSPFIDRTPYAKFSQKKFANNQKPANPVLHHVLDKTYRVQATPLSKGYGHARSKFPATPKNQSSTRFGFDDSPLSSPELEAPKLHEEIFQSPFKGKSRTPADPKPRPVPGSSRHTRVTPRPGVSVLTPGKTPLTRKVGGWQAEDDDVELIGYDDEDDDRLDVSPPKTMQFHIPQSRLMKTPGKSFIVFTIGLLSFCRLSG
jgi:DASH complex subunit ASK1